MMIINMSRGTSEYQLNRAMRGDPRWAGTHAADQLPRFESLPHGAFLIANYDNAGQGGSHWIAFGNLNAGGKHPLYFDSFGLSPDQLNDTLGAKAHFKRYLDEAARHNGRAPWINRVDLQCMMPNHAHNITADVCGEFAVLFCRWKVLPVDPATGHLNKQWAPIFSWRSSCEKSEHLVKKLAGIRG